MSIAGSFEIVEKGGREQSKPLHVYLYGDGTDEYIIY
jgi:hypothetical protein